MDSSQLYSINDMNSKQHTLQGHVMQKELEIGPARGGRNLALLESKSEPLKMSRIRLQHKFQRLHNHKGRSETHHT